MPLILAVDTTAKAVSCALIRDGQVVASYYSNTGLTHSQTLMPMIESLLGVSKRTVDDLDAVAVNVGPGSFTGVRIGVSAVKGIAFTGNLPCVPVSTLECMAAGVTAIPQAIICCLMDARCQQVYGALFEKDNDGELHRLSPDEALSIREMGERLIDFGRPVILVGDGSEMCYRLWEETIPNIHLAPASVRHQNAAAMAEIATQRFNDGLTVSAAELQPLYLRLPQAERELNARLSEQ